MYSSVAPPGQKQPTRPDGVSETNWQKFQHLKERRLKLAKQSKGKKRSKPNKKSRSISSETQTEDKQITNQREISQAANKRENEEKWRELKQHFPHSTNLGTSNSQSSDSNYDEEINKAIERGDFKEAESLSDQVATKDILSKAAQAIRTRDFAEKRKAHEEQKQEKKRKKKKLHWGFEQKQRWESKGNM